MNKNKTNNFQVQKKKRETGRKQGRKEGKAGKKIEIEIKELR